MGCLPSKEQKPIAVATVEEAALIDQPQSDSKKEELPLTTIRPSTNDKAGQDPNVKPSHLAPAGEEEAEEEEEEPLSEDDAGNDLMVAKRRRREEGAAAEEEARGKDQGAKDQQQQEEERQRQLRQKEQERVQRERELAERQRLREEEARRRRDQEEEEEWERHEAEKERQREQERVKEREMAKIAAAALPPPARKSLNPFDDEPEEENTPLAKEEIAPEDYKDANPLSFVPSDFEYEEGTKLGEVLLTVQHNASSEELTVRIKRSRNILQRGTQLGLYFKVLLFPDPSKKYSYQTEVKVSPNEQIFDESFTFTKISESDMERKILQIVACDKASPGEQDVGEIRVRLKRLKLDLATPKWMPLWREKVDDAPAVPEIRVSGNDSPLKRQDADNYSVAPSMMSSMSHMSTSVIVKNQDYGKIHLSLNYRLAKQTLQIVVIGARLNRPPGASGLPNPYAKLYLIPDPSKKSKQKTKPQKATLDPLYNETFEFKLDKSYADKRLQVTIWDHENLGRNLFMGEARIELGSLPPNETVNKHFPLESMAFGELNCVLSYDQQKDYLSITVVKARDLVSYRANMSIDPYVKLYLVPDHKKQTKKKTHYRKQTVNPEFNETIEYFLGEFEGGHQRYLHVSVLDHNSVGSNEVVGSYSIPVLEIVEATRIERWFPLIKDRGLPHAN